jgi:hypothetical protein
MTREMMHGLNDVAHLLPRQSLEQLEFVPEPVPCDDCLYATTCRRRQLACQAFAQYVKNGRWTAQSTLRLPSRRSYRQLYRC